MREKITILGAGSFGTALADLNMKAGRDVILWGRRDDPEEALRRARIALFAIPTQYLRQTLESLKKYIEPETVLINLAKGIEIATQLTPFGIFLDVFGTKVGDRYATISGPTFAKELIQNMPSGAVIAAKDKSQSVYLQKMLSTHTFRLYSSTDIIGVELGGALKNIYAISVGISDGLGYGNNTRAGLITRCLHEMSVLGRHLGANPRTFAGLSGIGDLILTCTGDLSRNRQVGLKLGRGETLSEILKSLHHVAEGVPTTKSVHELANKLKIELPNAEQIYKVLYEGLSPKQATENLLSRALKGEFEDL